MLVGIHCFWLHLYSFFVSDVFIFNLFGRRGVPASACCAAVVLSSKATLRGTPCSWPCILLGEFAGFVRVLVCVCLCVLVCVCVCLCAGARVYFVDEESLYHRPVPKDSCGDYWFLRLVRVFCAAEARMSLRQFCMQCACALCVCAVPLYALSMAEGPPG